MPRLAGQDLDYLLKLLRGFKAQTASDLDGTMTTAAQPLSAEDVENLAHYLASRRPPRADRGSRYTRPAPHASRPQEECA